MTISHSHSPFNPGMENILGQVIQGFMQYMSEKGLTMPQVHALMYIFHNGECQVSDIGKLADASMAAASQMAERLVQQGLVERKEDPSNRRIKKLSLSDKGRQLILDSITSNPALRDKLASLTPDERNMVHAAFSLLAKNDQDTIIGKAGKHAQDQ